MQIRRIGGNVKRMLSHFGARRNPSSPNSLDDLLSFYYSMGLYKRTELTRRSSPIDDLCYYHLLCRFNRVTNVIEIGTFNGLSAIFLATACKGTVFTININKNEILAAKTLARKARVSNIEFLEGDSLDILPELSRRLSDTCSFVYIDGFHDYKYSFNEYQIATAHINKQRGLVIIDDADYIHEDGKHDGGVPRMVEEVKAIPHESFNRRFAYKVFGDFEII